MQSLHDSRIQRLTSRCFLLSLVEGVLHTFLDYAMSTCLLHVCKEVTEMLTGSVDHECCTSMTTVTANLMCNKNAIKR